MADLDKLAAQLDHIHLIAPLAPIRRAALRQAAAELRAAAGLKAENDELRRELQRIRWHPARRAPGA